MFLKSFMLTKAAFIWLKKNSNIDKYYFNVNYSFMFKYIFKYNLFLWHKSEFSAS